MYVLTTTHVCTYKRTVLQIADQLLERVDTLHTRHLIHRDIKPVSRHTTPHTHTVHCVALHCAVILSIDDMHLLLLPLLELILCRFIYLSSLMFFSPSYLLSPTAAPIAASYQPNLILFHNTLQCYCENPHPMSHPTPTSQLPSILPSI